MHRQDTSHDIKEKISARLVTWQGNGKWEGSDVIVFKVDSEGKFTGEPGVFKSKEIEIREKPKDFINNQWDPRFMSYGQLRRYLTIFKVGSPETIRRLKVDLNYKLSFPFTALVAILICAPFSIETGRANPLVGMVRGITISMLYVPLMACSLAMGKGGALSPPVAAWLSNVVFAVLGMYFINRRS